MRSLVFSLSFLSMLIGVSSVGQNLVYTIAGPNFQIPTDSPTDIEVDKAGNVYFCESGGGYLRKISAENGSIGFFSNGYTYTDMSLDSNENIFAASWNSGYIKQIDFNNQIFMGDIWDVTNGNINIWVYEVLVDKHGNLYARTSENYGTLYRRDAQTLAVQTMGTASHCNMAKDPAGNVYFADSNKIKKIDPNTQQITVFAGTGSVGTAGDGGPAINAELDIIYGMNSDPWGNIFVYESERIRKIDLNGIITTYAGVIGGGLTAEGIPATSTSVSSNFGGRSMAIDHYGNLYFCVSGSGATIRKITGVPPELNLNSANLSISVYNQCNTTNFIATTPVYNSNYDIKTYYSDGSFDTQSLYQTNGTGYLPFSHAFPFSGTYKIKHVLCNGNTPIDSISYEYDYHLCRSIASSFYFDTDNDCTYTPGTDEQVSQPITIAVDSNNVTIDTLSVTSGFVYNAYGNDSDVYTFNLINIPVGLQAACTTITDTLNSPIFTGLHSLPLQCNGTMDFDISVHATQRCAANRSETDIVVNNSYCNGTNSQLTMTFSPKYTFHQSVPAPTSQSGNTATWDLNSSSFENNSLYLHVNLNYNGQILTVGDTVQTIFELTPITGDVDPSNNTVIKHDTVTGPYDPNAVYVSPTGCVEPGTELQYTVTFENMGNDTAHNIYVMDTLSAGVNMQSMKIIAASHLMNVTKVSNGGYNVLKFEFPNIGLPDSSNPARHGMVMYTIDVDGNWPDGATITNRAGIYFDYMPAVLTNEAETDNCIPAGINAINSRQDRILLYPNPATNELTIKADKEYLGYTITNSIGQVMVQQQLNSKEAKVNIRSLSPGLYYINLKGDSGNEVRKFIKM